MVVKCCVWIYEYFRNYFSVAWVYFFFLFLFTDEVARFENRQCERLMNSKSTKNHIKNVKKYKIMCRDQCCAVCAMMAFEYQLRTHTLTEKNF